jgi:tetratricopeptide (TPR) repeat protein
MFFIIIFIISLNCIFSFNIDALSQVSSNQSKNIVSKITPLSQRTIDAYLQAIKYYDKALAINPNATDILNNKGMVLIKLGKYDEAIKVFDKILSLNSKDVAGLYNKGVALGKLGKPLEAKVYQQKALQINPKYVSDFINRLSVANSLVPEKKMSK